jgi:hypothetical protein
MFITEYKEEVGQGLSKLNYFQTDKPAPPMYWKTVGVGRKPALICPKAGNAILV